MRHTFRRNLVLAASLTLLACAPENGEEANKETTAEQPAVPAGSAGAGSGAADTGAADSGTADAVSTWSLRPTGAGTVRIGMTLPELAPHIAKGDTAGIGDACDYVSIAGAPDSVGFMVEGRRLVRIDVFGGRTATAEGARIGDSEQQIVALYPGARRMPHKYTEGNYLVAIPGAPTDTVHRYVFETDGNRVTQFRAGVYPQVEYVEGCS